MLLLLPSSGSRRCSRAQADRGPARGLRDVRALLAARLRLPVPRRPTRSRASSASPAATRSTSSASRSSEQSRWTVALPRCSSRSRRSCSSGALGSGTGHVGRARSAASSASAPAMVAAFLALVRDPRQGPHAGGLPRPHRLRRSATRRRRSRTSSCSPAASPTADPRTRPAAPAPAPPGPHAQRRTSCERNRLIVVFRLILALPHFIWLTLWGVVVLLAALVGVAGRRSRSAACPRRCTASSPRYVALPARTSLAFRTLAGGPFPGFVGKAGRLSGRHRDRRRRSASRAGRSASAGCSPSPRSWSRRRRRGAGSSRAIGAWFFALFTGPDAARAAQRCSPTRSATARRSTRYALLLTPRYPHSGPSEEEAPDAG